MSSGKLASEAASYGTGMGYQTAPKLFHRCVKGYGPYIFAGIGATMTQGSRSAKSFPRSLRMTIAALRPGPPVTEPPGWVVAPV